MKTTLTISLFLLFICHSCFGQADSSLIAAGDWSTPVRDDASEPFLRGRLLVYDAIQDNNVADHTRIYLELQHVYTNHTVYGPIEIYSPVLDFEMQDGRGQPIPGRREMFFGTFSPGPYWVTLPCDATVRIRADDYESGLDPKPNGLEIISGGKCWVIPPNATNDFYLSASFTPSVDHPSPLHYIIWHGTLKLPKVKIPAKKQ